MRAFGALFIAILLALAAVVFLQQRSATESFEGVTRIAANLREQGVEGRPFDRELAERMLASLEELLKAPDEISRYTDELRTISAKAASWADAAASPSLELRVSVSLRAAAADLRDFAIRSSPMALTSASRNIEAARSALAGELGESSPPIDAVRDRMENLKRSQQERQQEIEEELNR
jgi:hypothetical protein